MPTDIEALRALLASRPRPTGIEERRRRLDALGDSFALPPDVTREALRIGDLPAEWSVTPEADPSRVLLYLHGGGFSAGSIASHRAQVAESGRAARARTLAIDYRRTPEHPFPAALEDALAAYRFLLAKGVAPSRLAVGGDSAGGGLTIALMLALREAGEALPACLWCISPWVDMQPESESYTTKAAADPMIERDYIRQLAGWYLAGTDAAAPLAAPIHADLAGLPPLLIQVGSEEVLLDDSVRLASRAGAAQVRVTLEIWPGMIHAFPLFYQILADGRRAIHAAGAFIAAATVG